MSHSPVPPNSVPPDDTDWDERLSHKKTEIDLTTAQLRETLDRAAEQGKDDHDPQQLAETLSRRDRQCAELEQAVMDLKIQVDALRNDYSALEAEHKTELDAYQAVVDERAHEREEFEDRVAELNDVNRKLKAQNLDLQYHLSQWGLPVHSGAPAGSSAQPPEDKAFFPPLIPLEGNEDPIPVVLRGDLKSVCFPDLVSFLANSSLVGVLTVVSDDIVSKLYLDRGVLRLAALNDADPSSTLLTLLEGAGKLSSHADQFRAVPLFDLELVVILLRDDVLSERELRQALEEHARFILSQVFQLDRGAFFFQPGQVEGLSPLHFRLPLMDVLLHTAAEVDERQRIGT